MLLITFVRSLKVITYSGVTTCSPSEKHPTYVNEPLNRESYIDYIFVSRECQVNKFSVSDPDINFSDHLPLLSTVSYIVSPAFDKTKAKQSNGITTQMQLRWDRADIGSFIIIQAIT